MSDLFGYFLYDLLQILFAWLERLLERDIAHVQSQIRFDHVSLHVVEELLFDILYGHFGTDLVFLCLHFLKQVAGKYLVPGDTFFGFESEHRFDELLDFCVLEFLFELKRFGLDVLL